MIDAELTDREKMLKFWRHEEPAGIGNCQKVELEWTTRQGLTASLSRSKFNDKAV